MFTKIKGIVFLLNHDPFCQMKHNFFAAPTLGFPTLILVTEWLGWVRIQVLSLTHTCTIDAWYMYLHVVDLYEKSDGFHTIDGWVRFEIFFRAVWNLRISKPPRVAFGELLDATGGPCFHGNLRGPPQCPPPPNK